jgi:23S rRNA (cytidine1920-2'-O)/16S rRNA (cytidine1409-2'-O)-methyltransferase
MDFVSRAGEKLDFALKEFKVDVAGKTCGDFGSSTGGFVDALLQAGAEKVYAVETGYGILDWKMRKDDRVIVMERSNAMHVELPEKVDFLSVDTSWTRMKNVLPNAIKQIKKDGQMIVLVKPHYEAEKSDLVKGVLPEDKVEAVLERVIQDVEALGLHVLGSVESPIKGKKGGNTEHLLLVKLSE